MTETIALKQSVGVVVGLGLNVNTPETILETIDQPATSLHLFLNQEIPPHSLLKPLLDLFVTHLAQLQKEGFSPFQKRFNEILFSRGKEITVQLPNQKLQGVCESITAEGYLKLHLPSGEFVEISAGEII